MRKKGFLLTLVLLLALATALAGCGARETAAPNQSQPATTDGGSGNAGGDKTLVFGRGSDAVGLDPANVTDGESIRVTHQIFDTLVQYNEEDTTVKPALATEWNVSEDGKVWTFKLREGVKFHDGTDFNADAVVFNFQRWMDKNHPYHHGDFEYYGYMFGGFPGIIQKVEKTGPYEVKITLKEPNAPFLQTLAMPAFAIASPAAIKKYGKDFFKNPVGTGPFIFKEWKKDDRIVLERNDNYWGEKAKIKTLIFRVIPDNAARFLELQAGTIDIMDGLNPEDVPNVKNNPDLQLILRPSMNVGYLAMNMDKKPFDNPKVRQAINHAINKQALIDAFYGGLAKPAKNPLPPTLWGYNDEIQDYEYNPEKAKALLAEAGYPNGFKTTLWAMPNPRPYMPQPQQIAQAIAADLAKVGIEAKIVSYEWGTYLEKTKNGEHDMALLGWTGDNGDPDNFLYVLLDKDNAVKGSAGNISFYRSDELHALLIQAQRETDQKKREELYKKAQEIIHRDAPWVPLAHATPPLAARAYVKNYVPHPTGSEPLNKVDVQK
ncbi:ABC transporter substrate-binding protein [Calditerricola satsumensis]|uniref:ABC transporter substrate-binding protein n=1 Tax=Calditerricola satsumensis TaxID=373054 RepID=A0A8J3B7K7_9BACI|nr:ABC transporter substrate-binding protein [Calditerricola satsumensis]GGJ91309.1 ABC transporter substrate-binding protein [Calditerricola satsumensis]